MTVVQKIMNAHGNNCESRIDTTQNVSEIKMPLELLSLFFSVSCVVLRNIAQRENMYRFLFDLFQY